MPSPRIAFYISAHGFGHASRMKPVIERVIAAGAAVFIRSAAHPKFFADVAGTSPGQLHVHCASVDVGAVQADGLSVDARATLERYAALNARRGAIIEAESRFLADQGVDLVVGDIPPLAFAIAAAAGVPSIAASHFTWDWIYEPYVARYPEYAGLLDAIRADYAQATLALQMPFAHDFGMFRQVEPIPLIVRERVHSDEAVRALFAVPPGARLAVLSMGGMRWGRTPLEPLHDVEDWVFVLPPDMGDLASRGGNFRAVPEDFAHYHDLPGAADLVIAKAGAVTVSECITYRTPLIYTCRDDFRENDLLRRALDAHARARFIARPAFEAGAWMAELAAFDRLEGSWRPLPHNGAAVAADRILTLAAESG